VIDEMTTVAKRPSGGLYVASMVAALAVTGSAFAQDRTPERRLVQAFIKYCVETSADPDLRAEIEKGAPLKLVGETRFAGGRPFIDSAEILDPTARRDPHLRMLIYLREGGFGHKRTCQVNMPWGEKAKVVAEVVSDLRLADGTSSVVREGEFDTDLTRWTTRIGDKEAVIEFGMPTYAGAAGRALTLSLEE
jgi:hypothetical protein